MKLIMVFLLMCWSVLLVSGCAKPASLFDRAMADVVAPNSYVVNQEYFDSGFAGVDSVNQSASFIVQNEMFLYPIPNGSKAYMMSDVYSIVQPLDFNDNRIQVGESFFCFLQEQYPVMASVVCFNSSRLVAFHQIITKGNHQYVEEKWSLEGYDPLFSSGCTSGEGVFCPIIIRGYAYDKELCSRQRFKDIYGFESSCTQIVATHILD